MVLSARGEMLMGDFIIREKCPIGLKVCANCYWRKEGKCVFPPEGYDLRSRLETERKHVVEELERLKAGARQAGERKEGSPSGKWEEAATDSSEFERELALEAQIIGRLTKVEHALDKFDNGTYGLCDNCGQPIDLARLEALPEASLCLSCKAQGEKAKSRSIPRRERVARYPGHDEKMHILNFNVPEPADSVEDMEDVWES